MKGTLWIDPRAGISGDRFAAVLIGLGAPEQEMPKVIKSATEELSMLNAHTHIEFLCLVPNKPESIIILE